jgi:hypothetical protein
MYFIINALIFSTSLQETSGAETLGAKLGKF